jgi:hypothetical protein
MHPPPAAPLGHAAIDGHHRHTRVTEAQWRAGRGIYLTGRRRSRGDNARRFEQAGVRLPKPR